jgi:hypothetical protein
MVKNANGAGDLDSPKEKGEIAWACIEWKFRLGVVSIREIARQHQITDRAIRKRAKRENWRRDLRGRVKAQVRAELVRSEVRTATRAHADREIEQAHVNAAANAVMEVIEKQRNDLARARRIVEQLLAHLHTAATHRTDIETDIVHETQSDTASSRRGHMLRCVSLSAHSATARDLLLALKILITLERQTLNMNRKPMGEAEDDKSFSQKIAQQILTELNDLVV